MLIKKKASSNAEEAFLGIVYFISYHYIKLKSIIF